MIVLLRHHDVSNANVVLLALLVMLLTDTFEIEVFFADCTWILGLLLFRFCNNKMSFEVVILHSLLTRVRLFTHGALEFGSCEVQILLVSAHNQL